MKPPKRITLVTLLLTSAALTPGCKQDEPEVTGTAGGQLDTTKPISQVSAEADKMDPAQLRAVALKYSEAFKAKTAEGEKLAAELIKLAMSDAAAEKTKAIKDKVAAVNAEAAALGERLKVYVEKLKAKGGDTTGLEM